MSGGVLSFPGSNRARADVRWCTYVVDLSHQMVDCRAAVLKTPIIRKWNTRRPVSSTLDNYKPPSLTKRQ